MPNQFLYHKLISMIPKISAFPKCYIEDIAIKKTMNLEQWIDMSVDLNADGLEMYNLFLESYEPAYLAHIRNRVEESGRTIPMFCCSPDLCNPDPDIRKNEIEKQKASIKAAALLGCSTCRVLSGQRNPQLTVDSGVNLVVFAIRDELLPLAHDLGITLAMENHYKDPLWMYPEFAQKKAVFVRIIRAIDDTRFGVQFDPSNAIVAGEDPVQLMEEIKDRIVSMHASDRYLLPGHDLAELAEADGNLGYSPILKHGEVGKGLNNYDKIFSILKEIGYNGWISIEDGENGMEEMARSIDFLKNMRKKYFKG
jgi:sugar phosphate isomerase/epimerase